MPIAIQSSNIYRGRLVPSPINHHSLITPAPAIVHNTNVRRKHCLHTVSSHLSSDRNAILRRRRAGTVIYSLGLVLLLIQLVCTCLPVQEAALLDRATTLKTSNASVLNIAISAASLACSSYTGRGQVRDVFGERVLGANTARVD
jgi:hypothetical protein